RGVGESHRRLRPARRDRRAGTEYAGASIRLLVRLACTGRGEGPPCYQDAAREQSRTTPDGLCWQPILAPTGARAPALRLELPPALASPGVARLARRRTEPPVGLAGHRRGGDRLGGLLRRPHGTRARTPGRPPDRCRPGASVRSADRSRTRR